MFFTVTEAINEIKMIDCFGEHHKIDSTVAVQTPAALN